MGNSKNVICPHCGVKGDVDIRRAKLKKGISGGKATEAVLTGGLSMLGMGLSRKETVSEGHCCPSIVVDVRKRVDRANVRVAKRGPPSSRTARGLGWTLVQMVGGVLLVTAVAAIAMSFVSMSGWYRGFVVGAVFGGFAVVLWWVLTEATQGAASMVAGADAEQATEGLFAA